jgi:diacylglycerol kinase (ATP)
MHRLSQIPGFERRDPTPAELADWPATMAPDSPVRLGLLSNPMASTNWRSVGHDRLVPLLPDTLAAVSTSSLADLPWALGYLLFQRRANVLAINGGDGTIHHAVNALIRVIDAAAATLGRPLPLPRLLLLNGGGMNMLARTFDTRGHPRRTVDRFLSRAHGAPLSRLHTTAVPLLSVEEEGLPTRHGFIFGSELVLNALTMYERYGQGYRGLSRFLWAAGAGVALQTETWRRFGHLLDPPTTPVTIDGAVIPTYAAVVATTVPMAILRGAITAVRHGPPPGTLGGFVVTETDPARLIALIPRLMRAAQDGPGLRTLAGAREARLQGPYTLDGELVRRADAPPGPIRVAGTTRLIDGVRVS